MKSSFNPVFAIIDPVGQKAGMDHYNELLLESIEGAGTPGIVLSNFKSQNDELNIRQTFFNTDIDFISSKLKTITGYFRSIRLASDLNVKWIIFHLFESNWISFLILWLIVKSGFKTCIIVHDIESLEGKTNPFIRNLILKKLSNHLVVHNAFSLEAILSLHPNAGLNIKTTIIPHVHFISLFRNRHDLKESSAILKEDRSVSESMSPELKNHLESGYKTLLFFGQIKGSKGLGVLLHSIKSCPENFRLVIAGKTRDESWVYYADLIEELNIGNRIIPIIRHISDRERDALFSICDVIILPYLRIYQSGVLLMALSFPKAVIASDLPANKELIEDGSNGLLFKSGDHVDLSNKISMLLNDAGTASSFAENGLKKISMQCDPAFIGKQFTEILSK